MRRREYYLGNGEWFLPETNECERLKCWSLRCTPYDENKYCEKKKMDWIEYFLEELKWESNDKCLIGNSWTCRKCFKKM